MNPDYRSVIIFLTDRCPVGCATCNTGARPDGGQVLTSDWLYRFLPVLNALSPPVYIVWTGGEPFEAFESLTDGIRIASTLGYRSEVLSSGCWYSRHPEYLSELSKAGMFSVRISLDAEHQRTVAMDTVHALIDDVLERRIPVGFTLRRIPSARPAPNEYINRLLERHPMLKALSETFSRLFHVIPTIPESAQRSPDPAEPTGTRQDVFGPCRLGFRDLVIGPDGRVYPCCGLFGLGIDDRVAAGDAISEFPEPVLTRMVTRVLFHGLINRGPYALAVENDIIPTMLPPAGYAGQCHACRLILPVLLSETGETGSSTADSDCVPGSEQI